MKVIIAGSRTINDYSFIKKYLYLKEQEKISIHYGDVVCYTAVLKEIDDMDVIINAI